MAVNITLPDGSKRTFDNAVTVAQVAQSIGAGLAKAALAGKESLGTFAELAAFWEAKANEPDEAGHRDCRRGGERGGGDDQADGKAERRDVDLDGEEDGKGSRRRHGRDNSRRAPVPGQQ